MGVTLGEIINALKALWLFLVMMAIFAKFGDAGVDPSNIEVGSVDWYNYVKQFSHLNV